MHLYTLVTLMELVGLAAIAMVTAWMGVYRGGWKWDGTGKEFNFHPVFMTIGLVFLYGNGAIAYRVFRSQDKFQVKLLHGCIHTGAFIFAVVGMVNVFNFHNKQKIPNMYSMHSWIGMATLVLFACQLVVGTLSFLYPKLPDAPRANYLVVHVCFGVGVFLMAIMACLTGATEKLLFSIKPTYPQFVPEGILANSLGMVLILFAGLVLVIVLSPKYKRPVVLSPKYKRPAGSETKNGFANKSAKNYGAIE